MVYHGVLAPVWHQTQRKGLVCLASSTLAQPNIAPGRLCGGVDINSTVRRVDSWMNASQSRRRHPGPRAG